MAKASLTLRRVLFQKTLLGERDNVMWNPMVIFTLCLFKLTAAVRLHKLFQFIDGFKSEHNLLGFLHVGNDYAVFLRAPKPHDKHLVYELYEAKNLPELGSYKPRLLAISNVPVSYLKEQLKMYRSEVYKAKYLDPNVVPGTQVRTLREWQIQKALGKDKSRVFKQKMPVLRSIL